MKIIKPFFFVALLAGGAAAVRGQFALDGFDPHANDRIYAVAVQIDGQVLVGGSFTTLAPNGGPAITRNHIARFNTDGTLDTNFNPNASGTVYVITLNQGTGGIYVGGDFTTIGGQPRKYIARLDGLTGAADLFDANANNAVRSIAGQLDGKVIVGGLFNGTNSIGGQTRNRIARLDGYGLADSFNPNANDVVLSIAVQADGKILAGGNFDSIGGTNRNHVARLDATTGLAEAFNPNANLAVYSIAEQADGKILAAGNFTSIGGQARRSIARLDAATGLADSFDPKANNDLRSIVVQADGKILAGGYFTTLSPNGGVAVARNGIARLNPDGALDAAFDPTANSDVQSIAVQFNDKIVAGGSFTALAPNGGTPVSRNYVARLETDGRLEQTLNVDINGYVSATAVQPDGKILIGGIFATVSGVARTNMARLNADGTLDTVFNPNANGAVHSIAVQADGRILACGEFNGTNSIGGATRNHIARLQGATGVADSFDPNASGIVYSMAVQADGKILACGIFTNIDGYSRNYIARLNSDGTLDTDFDPNADSDVDSMAVQQDGKILAGGNFTIIGGQPRHRIARLDATHGMADAFNPNADSSVDSIVVQENGDVLVGGSFTNIGGATRNHMARLYGATGAADAGFDPNADGLVLSIAAQADGSVVVGGQFLKIGGEPRNRIARIAPVGFVDSFDPNANDSVYSLALQADGKILVGGQFNGTNSIGGHTRNFFARFGNDTSAYQDFSVYATAVSWSRYASPQFSRVTFEFSTNNVNYTLLGNGERNSFNFSIWSLSGLNLPTGHNFYIRARGYYSSGNSNGSESIQESVRIAFLPAPPPRLNIQAIANTNVVLSWATNSAGFTLEANTNLTANVWSVVSPAPAVSGTNNVVTNAVSGSARFYRLRQ